MESGVSVCRESMRARAVVERWKMAPRVALSRVPVLCLLWSRAGVV